MKTFTRATDEFLKGLDYLGDLDPATVTSIENAAHQLDEKFGTTLLAEYNKTVRYIKSLAPVEVEGEEEDPLLGVQD